MRLLLLSTSLRLKADQGVRVVGFLAIAAVRWSVDGTGPDPVQD